MTKPALEGLQLRLPEGDAATQIREARKLLMRLALLGGALIVNSESRVVRSLGSPYEDAHALPWSFFAKSAGRRFTCRKSI